MTSQDDLTLLKQMYQRDEITDEQYDALRRHVLWGTPLPQLIDEVPPAAGPQPPGYGGPDPSAAEPRSRRARHAAPAGGHSPAGRLPARPVPDRQPEPAGPPAEPGSRRARREAAEAAAGHPAPPGPTARRPAAEQSGYPPPAYLPAPPAPAYLPPAPPVHPGDGGAGRPDPAGPDPAAERGSRRARREARADAAAAPGRSTERRGAPGRPQVEDAPGRSTERRGAPGRPQVEDVPRRARRRRSLFAVLTSVLLALALVAAGVYWFALRETGVPPADYARSVCGGVRDWQQQVDSRSSALVGSVVQEPDRTAVRTAVTTYYTDLAGRTDRLRTAVLGAGVADVSGGRAYADSLAAAVGDQATALRDLSARAARLDPTAEASFQVQLLGLLTGAQTAVSEVTAALARPAAGTPAVLRTALSDEPACAPYVG